MKHNIRINGEIKEIDCELGSGRLDANDREIFENDIVQWSTPDQCATGTVKFTRGELVLLGNSLYVYKCRDLEVIGHVDD